MKSLVPLIQMFQLLGPIKGRKKLQKMVHLLQECGNADFGLSFCLSHYGAFSAELANTLDTLEEQKLIESTVSDAGEYPTQEYIATERLITVLQYVPGQASTPSWKDLAIELNGKLVRELEAISTIVFLRKAGLSDDDVKAQFQLRKAHLINIYEQSCSEADRLMQLSFN
jgi:uncharacterized protein